MSLHETDNFVELLGWFFKNTSQKAVEEGLHLLYRSLCISLVNSSPDLAVNQTCSSRETEYTQSSLLRGMLANMPVKKISDKNKMRHLLNVVSYIRFGRDDIL